MSNLYKNNPVYRSNMRKTFLFLMLISIAIGIIFCQGYSDIYTDVAWSYKQRPMLMAGFIVSPPLTYIFVREKGIYSACILLIFLAELSLMCTSLKSNGMFFLHLGDLTFGMLVPYIILTTPAVVHYFLGAFEYVINVLKCYAVIFMGFFVSFSIGSTTYNPYSAQALIILTFFALASSFLTLFSAWNHRLVLLK